MERWSSGAKLGTALALAALAGLSALLLYLVAGPVLDNDVWWHLAHGRAYLAHGPWLDVDPCLGTAERGPIPHSWLFDAAASAIEGAAGLQGLRAVHALLCVAIGALAFSLCRRESGGLAPAALATGVFGVLAWYRLVQVRPEVPSILFTLLLHRWLFLPALPSWRQVALACGLVALWANVHALFLVGPLLMAAALAGVGARITFARLARFETGDDPARAGRLAAALGLSLLASLANPRGIRQHLAYLESSGAGAIQQVYDEWARFDAFHHGNASPAVSALAWVTTDLLLLAFAVAAVVGLVRLLRAPSRERLDDVDPMRMALGVAGIVALFTAIRFLWLGWFAAIFLLHVLRRSRARSGAPAGASRGDLGFAAALLLLLLCFPAFGGFRDVAGLYPKRLSRWLAEASTGGRFFDVGVRFLAESGVRGQLFNDYALGGYLCHELAPAIRTFVDGSMNFPEPVAIDYRAAVQGRGARPGESLSQLLDRRGVDLYFGFGVPAADGSPYSTTALAGHPGWRLVSRSWRHGIYLRANERNAANLAQVAAWYEQQGIPFDPAVGLDVGRVLREHREWADAWQMLPGGWSALIGKPPSDDLARRVRELETLGLGYALVGAWEEGVRNDRRAAALRPRAKAPRRRLVYDLLWLGRIPQAHEIARGLLELDPDDPRSRAFAAAVAGVAAAPDVDARNARIDALPLLASRQPLRQ